MKFQKFTGYIPTVGDRVWVCSEESSFAGMQGTVKGVSASNEHCAVKLDWLPLSPVPFWPGEVKPVAEVTLYEKAIASWL